MAEVHSESHLHLHLTACLRPGHGLINMCMCITERTVGLSFDQRVRDQLEDSARQVSRCSSNLRLIRIAMEKAERRVEGRGGPYFLQIASPVSRR